MKLQAKALVKWTLITIICGAASFFWGVLAKASPTAMVLGMLTLILVFSLIESHPAYQARRLANPRMAQALDWGVKFRVFLTFYVFAVLILGWLFATASKNWHILEYPYLGEIMIGAFSITLCQRLTGLDLNAMNKTPMALDHMDRFLATYCTTLITGIAHTLILALICGVMYVVVRLKQQDQTSAQ